MKKKSSPVIWIIVGIIGLGLMLYPLVGNLLSTRRSDSAIALYQQNVSEQDRDVNEAIRQTAQVYNESLSRHIDADLIYEETGIRYEETLLNGNSTVIGTVVIPKINVSLPIYHGTGDDVMSHGIGHVEWTSLPIGGIGSHAVLSGHRGLPGAVLFSDLDRLTIGDSFKIRVLGDELTYRVDQIRVVEPEDYAELFIHPQKDYVTLLTCTPYGINSHRLLVRGERVTDDGGDAQREAFRRAGMDPMLSVSLIALPILLGLLILVMVSARRNKERQTDNL